MDLSGTLTKAVFSVFVYLCTCNCVFARQTLGNQQINEADINQIYATQLQNNSYYKQNIAQ